MRGSAHAQHVVAVGGEGTDVARVEPAVGVDGLARLALLLHVAHHDRATAEADFALARLVAAGHVVDPHLDGTDRWADSTDRVDGGRVESGATRAL